MRAADCSDTARVARTAPSRTARSTAQRRSRSCVVGIETATEPTNRPTASVTGAAMQLRSGLELVHLHRQPGGADLVELAA